MHWSPGKETKRDMEEEGGGERKKNVVNGF